MVKTSITIDGGLRARLDALTPDQQERLRLEYPNAKFAQALRRGSRVWGITPTLDAARIDGEYLVLPRGATRELREVVGSSLEWNDERFVAEPKKLTPLKDFRPNQIACARALLRYEHMASCGATGSGKTAVMPAATMLTGQATFIEGPTIDVCDQIAQTYREFLGIEPAMMTGGACHVGFVTIATPETAIKHADSLVGRFGLKITDEAHLFLTDRRRALWERLDAKFSLALTATAPTDEAGRLLFRWTFGEVRHRYGIDEGVRDHVLVVPIIRRVETPFESHQEDYTELMRELVACEARKRTVIATIIEECAHARLGLVLATWKDYLRALEEGVRATGLRTGIVTGDVPKRVRAQVLSDAREGKLDCIFGSTVADLGLDLPTCDRLFLTFPASSEARLLQRLGRAIRASEGKGRPVVVDFIDSNVSMLAHQARKRHALFERTWGALRRAA